VVLVGGKTGTGKPPLVSRVGGRARELGLTVLLPLPSEDRPPKLHIRTARELEVHDRLATGPTNKATARWLFIVEKAVPVRGTNLLAQLGMAKRTEVAALAKDRAGVE
jgi:DNA-binding NarL/FixJ family response regulator